MMEISKAKAILGIIVIALSSCTSKSGESASNKIKFQQYMYHGKNLYQNRCANCHQKDGTGLGKLIPPLNSSFVNDQKSTSICAIKYGLEGPLTIKEIEYNGKMPAASRITPLEIAEVMTYISNSWGNEYGLITTLQVEQALKGCMKD